MTKVIGVRFRTAGKVYFFDPLQLEIKRGDHVIVETARGIEFGTVVAGEVHSYELKDRRTSKGEFLEVSMELKAKRGFHTLCMLDYMNDFSDVTISTME